MWNGLFKLLSLSLVMAVASFLAGLLPLSFGLSKNHSRLISSIGTGVLVGTCLIVIIPEGIETLYSIHGASEAHAPASETSPRAAAHNDINHDHYDPHAWIGFALVLGFILMYLIDQLPKHFSTPAFARRQLHISLDNLSQGPHRVDPSDSLDENDPLANSPDNTRRPRGTATTIGLVIHAAADGIALGASTFIEKSSVSLVVFLAIMIHKSPAAFGLTSVLLKQGVSKRLAKAHLIVFSLAAPLGALATWLIVNIVSGGQITGEEGTRFVTGMLLIFSGGTFLYVAMHTMQESARMQEEGADEFSNAHAYSSAPSSSYEAERVSLRDTCFVVVGMLLPLATQVGHVH